MPTGHFCQEGFGVCVPLCVHAHVQECTMSFVRTTQPLVALAVQCVN